MKKRICKLYYLLPLILTLLTFTALSACSSYTTPPPAPTITITSPTGNIVPQIGDVTVSVQVSNFNIVDKQGQANVSYEGHLHYFLDVEAPTTAGQPAIPASGIWAHVATTTYTFDNVTAGTHSISVELVNNDHTPLTPPVVAKVTFTAQAATTTPPPVQSATIDLIAQGISFKLNTITVPSGANVTVNFDNKDSGIPHNFALYTDSSANTPIFVGQMITGPKTITYTFTAPTTSGNYSFRCDPHPKTMTGTFVVQ